MKYSIVFKTDHGSGRISERILASTDSRDRADSLRVRISSVAGGMLQLRACKKVRVVAVDPTRFAVFSPMESIPQKGQVFNSLNALATAMKVNLVTLRSSLSRSYKAKKTKATVRGITYAYAE